MNKFEESVYNVIENFGDIEFSYLEKSFNKWPDLPNILTSLCNKGYIKASPSAYDYLMNRLDTIWYTAVSKSEAKILDKKYDNNDTQLNTNTDINLINVLDHGFVKYIDHMGNDLRTVNAARISFNKTKDVFDNTDEKLIDYLGEHEHFSPMRHNQVTLHLKVPIFVLRQLMKYRVASEVNEISSRYVDQGDADFYIPTTFRKQAKVNKQGSEGAVDNQNDALEAYLDACNRAFNQYNKLITLGVCREQARCVLPVSMYSEIYWTASLQTIAHFIYQREDLHAQWEIQEYARAVRKLVEPLFPRSLATLLKNNP